MNFVDISLATLNLNIFSFVVNRPPILLILSLLPSPYHYRLDPTAEFGLVGDIHRWARGV